MTCTPMACAMKRLRVGGLPSCWRGDGVYRSGLNHHQASFDHTFRLWPTPPASPAEALCSKITHNMTHEGWDEFVSPDIDYIAVCPGLPESSYAEPKEPV